MNVQLKSEITPEKLPALLLGKARKFAAERTQSRQARPPITMEVSERV